MSVLAAPSLLVRPLSGLRAADLPVAGGKGANLGELIAAGFAVPDGFVVTTGAYALAAEAAGVAADAPAAARGRLAASPVPPGIAEAIRLAYRGLGSPPVAVRSSATAEDLPEASFAGQQDTLLNVVGEEAVVDAVRRCWASLWNERAVAYRETRDVDPHGLGLAVVVQRMLDASTAGVLFTADPITGRRRRAAIDAVRGLGEQLVSGAVNPDHFLVDPRDGAVLERRGDSLDDARLRELAALGARVESHYGRPQDIEWAIDQSGRLWLVQSREITTLYPLPTTAPSSDADLRVYFSANVAQGVFEPFTTMGLQTFRLIGAAFAALLGRPLRYPSAGPPQIAEAGMRLFIDLTDVLRDPFGRDIPGRVMGAMEFRSKAIFTKLLGDPRLAPRGSVSRSRFRVLAAVLRTGVPQTALRCVLRPDATRKRLLREIDEAIASVRVPDPPADRLDAYERLILELPPRVFPRLVGMVAPGFASYVLASRLLGERARPGEMQTVLRGLANNPTTEMDLALWEVARRAREDPASRHALRTETPAALSAGYRSGALPPLLQAEMGAFLSRYGHRAIAEIDLGLKRWSEDPAHLLGAIANYQKLDDAVIAPDAQFARGAREAEAMIGTLLSRVHGPRRMVVRFLLGRARLLGGLREQPKFQMIRIFALGHAMLAPVGAALAARGLLDEADDIFFITLPEARRAQGGEDLRATVAERRAVYRRERARRHVPRVLLSDGTDAETLLPAAVDGAIRGTPASPGVAKGVARVILSPVGARLEPGEVLVAPSTDPGWTPLFLTAGALVMEMGGMMSHGAVVAREYGIPAVVGVPDATERIATGERVAVDGSAGTVARDDSG
ncbi:MAG TPA: PEP/pyruvate-binding domain-containing protein [Candidatus Limnocylindria bacterium]|nr:PEP/pyruvate-binding domain-containing protein [Candidatus Limnocylindria bacterium]